MVFPILAVKDVAASAAFYTNNLGFTLTMEMPNESGQAWFSIVTFGDANLGLMLDPDLQNRGNGVVLMFYVEADADIDAHYASAMAKGVTITEPIADKFWGDRTYSLTDPDGYALSICKTVKQMSPDEMVVPS